MIYSFIANDSIWNVNEKYLINDIEAPLLYFVIKDESIGLVQLLLAKPEIDVNATSITFYTTKEGIQKKKKQRSLLNIAVENEKVEIIQYLLTKPGIDVNANDIDCVEHYDLHITESSEEIPHLYHENQYTALYIAIRKGNNIIVNLLLDIPVFDINYIFALLTFSIKWRA